jgi:hypothetical protein
MWPTYKTDRPLLRPTKQRLLEVLSLPRLAAHEPLGANAAKAALFALLWSSRTAVDDLSA